MTAGVVHALYSLFMPDSNKYVPLFVAYATVQEFTVTDNSFFFFTLNYRDKLFRMFEKFMNVVEK